MRVELFIIYVSKINFTVEAGMHFSTIWLVKNDYTVEKNLMVWNENIVQITNFIVAYLLKNYFEVVQNILYKNDVFLFWGTNEKYLAYDASWNRSEWFEWLVWCIQCTHIISISITEWKCANLQWNSVK